MYDVLIVDDEVHAVRSVQAGIQWDRYPISNVHVAYNIRQAKEIIESHSVKLMICDIEMPQGSGLDLLEWVNAGRRNMETIFLTCHADFSYAQKALGLGSCHYMLKPVDFGELENAIAKAMENIRKDRQMADFEETSRHYDKLLEAHKPLVLETFWRDLLREAIPPSPIHSRLLFDRYGIPLNTDSKFLAIYIRIQNWHKNFTSRDERILEFALQNTAQEKLSADFPHSLVFPLSDHKLLAIIPQQHDHRLSSEKWLDLCSQYIEDCNRYFYCDISCYIGNRVYAYEMRDLVSKLQNIDENNITEVNKALVIERLKQVHSPVRLPAVRDWSEWLKQGDKDRLVTEIKHYLADIRHELRHGGAQWMQYFYQDFMQMIFFVLHVKGVQASQVFSQSLLTEKPPAALHSLKALQEWVIYVIEVTANQISATERNDSIVDRVKKYINENMAQRNITREEIAQHVYLNPDYLTRVFKKETGYSISDFLQLQKIEYAKRMLLQTNMPVGEIAMALGYSKLSFFSNLFKRAVSLNPLEYRKQNKKNS